jgi:hypothetical protein
VLRTVVDAVHRTPAAEPVKAVAPGLARISTVGAMARRHPVPGIVPNPVARPVRAVLSAVRAVHGIVPRPSAPDLGAPPPSLRPVRVIAAPKPAISVAGPALARDRADLRAHPVSASEAAPLAAGSAVFVALVRNRVSGAVPTPVDMTPPPMRPAPLDPVPCPSQMTGSASTSGTDLADPPVAGPDPLVTIRTELRRQAARLRGASILPDSRPG